jgi:hypothetical protein
LRLGFHRKGPVKVFTIKKQRVFLKWHVIPINWKEQIANYETNVAKVSSGKG